MRWHARCNCLNCVRNGGCHAHNYDSLAEITSAPDGVRSSRWLRCHNNQSPGARGFLSRCAPARRLNRGSVLSFNPRNDEMRAKAERSWETIRTLLANHLFTEEAAVLPWNGAASVGSPAACDILKKRYFELRSLVRTVDSVSFEDGSDAEISDAGKALCRLAVKLDDLMKETERRRVNKLRQYVFSSAEETRLSA